MKECCKAYMDEQFGGDEETIGELYAEYIASVREKIGETEAALAAGDWEKLDRVAHTIKGNALAAGDNPMADTAIALRKAAVLKDAGESAALVAKLAELEKEL
ncbi:MAG: Hpt domain-containing protein [Kiritimatiellae bacterium]|nr:Hpt domain-containing protein [Kiritimatiellia bacterium]